MAESMKKYVSVKDSGTLYELGNISGPILNPVWMEIESIYKLLVNRRTVYEHSATNPSKRLKLTKENYDDFNLYPENAEIVDPSIDENTYVVGIADQTGKEEANLATGKMYVEILN